MSCTDVGAYLLGALEPDERDRFEDHVRGCAACRTDVAELGRLPALLAQVDPGELRPGPVAPSPDLYRRVSAAARRPRRRLALVAAALVVLAGGAAVGVATWPDGGDATTVTATDDGVRLTVTASSRGGGTALDITVWGLTGTQECRLVVVDREGRQHPAGEWEVRTAEADWRGWAGVEPDAISDVLLVDGGGRELVRVGL
jgi:anti-sigma factor RsiW